MWFRTALGWKLDDEPSAYGLAVTYQQLDDLKGLAEIQRLWAGRSERIAKVGEVEKPETANRNLPLANETVAVRRQPRTVVTAQEVEYDQQEQVAITRPRRTVPADRGCKSTIDPQTLAPEAALTRGWCLMERNRPMEAAAAFEVGMLGSSAKPARMRPMAKASPICAPVSQPKLRYPRSRRHKTANALELQQAILADKAVAAFDAGARAKQYLSSINCGRSLWKELDLCRFGAMRIFRLKRYADARQVFEALAAIGNRDGQRGLGILYQIFNDKD